MIYLLSRWRNIGYDEYDAKVVCAKDEKEAREIANEHVGDERQSATFPSKIANASVQCYTGFKQRSDTRFTNCNPR